MLRGSLENVNAGSHGDAELTRRYCGAEAQNRVLATEIEAWPQHLFNARRCICVEQPFTIVWCCRQARDPLTS